MTKAISVTKRHRHPSTTHQHLSPVVSKPINSRSLRCFFRNKQRFSMHPRDRPHPRQIRSHCVAVAATIYRLLFWPQQYSHCDSDCLTRLRIHHTATNHATYTEVPRQAQTQADKNAHTPLSMQEESPPHQHSARCRCFLFFFLAVLVLLFFFCRLVTCMY